MDSELNKHIQALVKDSQDYVKLQVEDTKLRVVERLARMGGQLSSLVITIFIFLCVVALLLVAGALFLGDLLGSMALGFCVVAFSAAISTWLVMKLKRQLISKPVSNIIVKSLLEEIDEDR